MSERAPSRPAPPDLLHPEPWSRLDELRLSEALVFGFATGDLDDVVERITAQARLVPSTFEPADFATDVFLPTFVERCLGITVNGHDYPVSRRHLERLIAHPPSDPAVTRFRQDVLRELADNPTRQHDAEALYRALVRFRDLLGKRPLGGRYDANRRRVDILKAIRDVVELASTRFDEGGVALRRIGAWGRALTERDAYRRLCELVDYESNLAQVDVRLVLGIDGSVRGLQPLARRENATNRFYQSPVGRFFLRILLYFRGYRFSDAEILSRLLDDVVTGLEDLLVQVFQLVVDLEFYLAALAFRRRGLDRGRQVCLPTFDDRGETEILELFNPLLLGGASGCVPCDLASVGPGGITIVTGPNSGGKTRLMQAVALNQALGQAGMFAPALQAKLPWVPGLFVSVIEQSTVDQCEGRLGMELSRIRRLFESVHVGSLIVLDELCSGTNPTEGEEIFDLVLELLVELRPHAYITTHFLAFAAGLEARASGLSFLQVELDDAEKPTYRFIPGVATTSLAHKVAERLGVTREELRNLIRRNNPELERPKGPRAVKVSAA